MRCIVIIIEKVDKGNTVLITDKEKYIKGIKISISVGNNPIKYYT